AGRHPRARPGHQGARPRERDRGLARPRVPGRRPRPHAQHRRGLQPVPGRRGAAHRLHGGGDGRRGGVLRAAPGPAGRVGAGRPPARRRGREPDRPHPRGRGDRLHRPAAVAGLQRRRRGDHLRCPRPPLRPRATARCRL
ncbi:MAG: Lipoprotein signal peptidase, partial [uncultured Solirubrobacteraceae bacterium]